MKYYSIPGTELSVSGIIMGCMRISSLAANDVETLVRTALDHGVNFFDHADIYAGGRCEMLFGEALNLRSSLREKMLIQSKCGIRKSISGGNFYDFSRNYILESVDGILSRLGTDYLDVLLLHRPDSLMELDEVAEAFDQLESSGKVRHFGLSNVNSMQIELLQRTVRQKLLFNQVQFGIGHTQLVDSGISFNTTAPQAVDRSGSLLEYARLNGITLQAWSPFRSDRTGRIIIGDFDNYPELSKVLQTTGERYGVSPSAIAAAWILCHPAHIQTVIGTTQTSRMAEYCAAADVSLSREEWYEIYQTAGNSIP